MRALGILLALALAACTAQLERGLSEESADEVVLALADHGIGATKESERGGTGFGVRVLEGDLSAALSALRDEGLPRTHGPSVAETFREPSLIPTAGEERSRLAAALGSDLERTIESLDGVRRARVHIGLPDPSAVPIDEQPEPRVASVLVQREDDGEIDEGAIRTLVTGAVPGLSAEHVSVVVVAHREREGETRLTQIGPIAVTEGSAMLLRGALGALLLVNVVLAVGLVVALRRNKAR